MTTYPSFQVREAARMRKQRNRALAAFLAAACAIVGMAVKITGLHHALAKIPRDACETCGERISAMAATRGPRG